MIRNFIRKVLGLSTGLWKSCTKVSVIPLLEHGIRRDQLSSASLKVTTRLHEAGFSAYVVGGAVRDLMLGISPKDFDVATNATPEEVRRVFRRSRIIGRRFRIVHVMVGQETIEVTTFRGGGIDDTNETGRVMADNSFGSQEEDAHRRDFTINALFYNPSDETIIDYHHGVNDLHAGKLVMIGPPAHRFQEDPVRMLRAVRLAAKLGFEIDDATRKPIHTHAHLLKREPPARLFDEMLKLLMSGQAYACLRKLREEGMVRGVFPLLDVVLDHNGDDVLLRLGLDSTDQRIRADKPVSVGFLLATLLWKQVYLRWQTRLNAGDRAVHALVQAIEEVESEQDHDFAIPRRFSIAMREIWLLQSRFNSFSSRRAYGFLAQPRFRAAYDLFVLRAEAGEVDMALVSWWNDFQRADEEERVRLLEIAKTLGTRDPERKRRRRPANRRKSLVESAGGA